MNAGLKERSMTARSSIGIHLHTENLVSCLACPDCGKVAYDGRNGQDRQSDTTAHRLYWQMDKAAENMD